MMLLKIMTAPHHRLAGSRLGTRPYWLCTRGSSHTTPGLCIYSYIREGLIWTKSQKTAAFFGTPSLRTSSMKWGAFWCSNKIEKHRVSVSHEDSKVGKNNIYIYRKNAKLIWIHVSLRLFLCDWTWTKSNLQKTQIWKLHLRNVVEADRGCYMCQVCSENLFHDTKILHK